MSVIDAQAAPPPANPLARVSALDVAAWIVLVLGLLAIWTKVQPFTDLQDYRTVDLAFQSSNTRKLVTLAIAGALGLLVLARGRALRLFQIVDAPLVAVLVWFAYGSLVSGAAGLALNRLVLACVVIGIAASLPLVFTRLGDYLSALTAAVLLAIGLSYAGILLVPDHAIHTSRDISEQALAGNWRGIFGHKNDLAPMAVHFVFLGLLLTRLARPVTGLVIVASAAMLLVFSQGKSALLLGPVCLALGLVVVRLPMLVSGLVTFGAIAGLAVATLGSLAFPPVADFVHAFLPDPTFTGRTEIWEAAMRAVGANMWVGYGYAVFWDTGQITNFVGIDAYVTDAAHSHSGYLEVILSGGFPGLVLVLLWAAVAPWRDIVRVRDVALDPVRRAVLEYLAMSWLFTILVSSLEAVLFNRGEPVWVMGLLAIAFLRYWARAGEVRL